MYGKKKKIVPKSHKIDQIRLAIEVILCYNDEYERAKPFALYSGVPFTPEPQLNMEVEKFEQEVSVFLQRGPRSRRRRPDRYEEPVSYTHLDVYKRQTGTRGRQISGS